MISPEIRPSMFLLQPIVKGSYREILFTVFNSPRLVESYDITGAQISFEVKVSRSGVSIITKRNTAAGGGDSEIAQSSSTSFKVFLEALDTNLTVGEYTVEIVIIKNSKTMKVLGTLPII